MNRVQRTGLVVYANICLTLVLTCNDLHGQEKINFNSQVRPIFAANCISCHGGVKQAGDVSFVYAEKVLPPEGWIVTPGNAEESELISRVSSDDDELRMPPPGESETALTKAEIDILTKWIEQGAVWGEHWSVAPLFPPSDIEASSVASKQHPEFDSMIDRLVQRELQSHGLSQSSPASNEQWLRRVSFDLIGLPPSNLERQSFLASCGQSSNKAGLEECYAAEVDRLLASPHFGERWAAVWLDLARYADTQGFEKDPHRDMWPFRDWVIQAFNQDMAYDQFTIKQLAGDLLSDPTSSDLIATGYHRNTQTNTEGGTDDEEYRLSAVIDRVNTTWTTWQATTFGCVQCHPHPYDPYEQRDYYRCLALFNNTEDCDLQSDFPTITLSDDTSSWDELYRLYEQRTQLLKQRNELGSQLARELTWQSPEVLEASSNSGELVVNDTDILAASGTFPVGVEYQLDLNCFDLAALKIDILPSLPEPLAVAEQGALLTQLVVQIKNEDGSWKTQDLGDVFADYIAGPFRPTDALEDNAAGFGGYPKLYETRWCVFVPRVAFAGKQRVRLTLKQKGEVAGSLATYVRHLRISTSSSPRWQELLVSPELKSLDEKLADADSFVRKQKGAQYPIMQQRTNQGERHTHLFVRGNWLQPEQETVQGSLPNYFAQRSQQPVQNRLQFAQWLVSQDNPLAARVWANRVWATLFGRGIVETTEDFGSSGTPPSNLPLLDYLAWQHREQYSWKLKPMLREIVLSGTYRQTNAGDATSYRLDPQNIWLSRGSRTRLSAEMIRDNALRISGLLNPKIGGPSVMPPQPDGIWQTVYNGSDWVTAEGQDRYRRAVYTYWKRTSPYPSFLTFDTPTRDVCSARRIPTNTPLQALVTLNDPVFTECASRLAEHALTNAGAERVHLRDCIRFMLESAAIVGNEDEMLDVLSGLYERVMQTSSLPSSEVDLENQKLQHSALTIVASAILNLDVALTK
ncbi:MAG: PSD1 domain-containing protein [Planctomycetales bacterium]|nr:PSD1 domain-containing protein [Planctomycetales bacterium]